jgi:hypothetical protein
MGGARSRGDRRVPCWLMTDQRNANEAVINEALEVIDGALAKMMSRELVSTGEVADLLLDVRSLLTTEADASTEVAAMPVIEAIEPIATETV